MRQDIVGMESQLLAVGFELCYARFRERFAYPLALVLGEEGEGIGSDSRSIERGRFHASRCTDMCSDMFFAHKSVILYGLVAKVR